MSQFLAKGGRGKEMEMKKEIPRIKVSMDLMPNGVKNVTVQADTAEGRDTAIERLRRCLPQLELLESALQAEPK
jgi:hypothetical protein